MVALFNSSCTYTYTQENRVFVTWMWLHKVPLTFNICSFSDANKETEPNTNLNNFRYKLERSMFAKKVQSQKH